jgi:hypothetical protein
MKILTEKIPRREMGLRVGMNKNGNARSRDGKRPKGSASFKQIPFGAVPV